MLFDKNDVKDFVGYIGKNRHLQTRELDQQDYMNIARYITELMEDIEDGVIKPINFIEEVYGDDLIKPRRGNHGHQTLQAKGKKRIMLLCYEFNEQD